MEDITFYTLWKVDVSTVICLIFLKIKLNENTFWYLVAFNDFSKSSQKCFGQIIWDVEKQKRVPPPDLLSKCWVLFFFRGNDRNAITEHCTCSLVRFSSHKHCVFDQEELRSSKLIIFAESVWSRNYLVYRKIEKMSFKNIHISKMSAKKKTMIMDLT